MMTTYLRCVGIYNDPVWGEQVVPWMYSPLIRCTRNRIRGAAFEWVGNKRAPVDLVQLRRRYGLILTAEAAAHCYTLAHPL